MTVTPVSDEALAVIQPLQNQWPPEPLKPRLTWLNELRAVYDGVPHVGRLPGPTVRWCKRACVSLAEFMTKEPPTAGGVSIMTTAYGAIIDMARYGGAILLDDGTGVHLLDPRRWTPTPTGWLYLSPEFGPNSATVEYATVVLAEGTRLFSFRTRFDGGELALAPEEVQAGMMGTIQAFAMALRLPLRGHWGTPLIESAADWQAWAQTRWRGVNKAQNVHERPLKNEVASEDQRVLADFARESAGEPALPADADPAEIAREAAQYIEEFYDDEDDFEEYINLPESQGQTFSAYDSKPGGALSILEDIRQEFEADTAGVGLLRRLDMAGGTVSGVALKRLLAPLYASVRSLTHQLQPALEAIYGPVELADPFEEFADEAQVSREEAAAEEALLAAMQQVGAL